MFKKSCFCLLFIISSLCVKSQQTIEYGIQGGLNINSAKISGNPLQNSLLAGFNIGTQVKINHTKHFGVKMIVQYEQRGFTYKDLTLEYPGVGLAKANILTRMNYIDLKILPVVSVGRFREFYLYGGPTIGVLIGNQLVTKYKDSLPAGNPSTITTKGSEKKAINFGLAVGIGTQLPIAQNIKISFDVRSDIGLSNVFKNGNAKLRSLSFSPGILFTL